MKMSRIIIAGGGIAGMYTALSLAKYGKYSITIVDQKTDLAKTGFNTLGSFLDVKKYNLPKEVMASRIDTTVMHSSHVSHKASGKAYVLDKVKLHKHLQSKLKEIEVNFKLGNKITDLQIKEGNITAIMLENGEEIVGDLFIDATGIKALLAKEFNILKSWDQKAYGIEYEIEYTGQQNKAIFFIGNYVKGGYGWLFPLKNNKAILGIGTFDKTKQRDLRDNLQKLLKHPSIAKYVTRKSNHTQGGVIPVRRPETKFVHKNLVCVGDSVAQVNPIVGEGYRFIIDSAEIAATAINEAMEKGDLSILHKYEDTWSKKYLKDYQMAYKLQQLINRIGEYDLLLDLGVLFLYTKRDSTVQKLYAGSFSKRDLLLP